MFLCRPNTTVIAALRDTTSSSAKDLSSLPKGENSSLITVKIDSGLEKDAATAVETLTTEFGVSKIDTVVANAGASAAVGPVVSVTAEQVLNNIKINGLGKLSLLFASFYSRRIEILQS